MNKADITKQVAVKLKVTHAKAAEAIEAVMSTFEGGAMLDDKAIYSPWVFKKKVSPERQGRDPRNGNSILIPTKIRLVYKNLSN